MPKTLSVNDISVELVITSAKNGEEIVLEENGEPIAKITPIEKAELTQPKQRILGLGEGKTWMSDDFDDELPDEFWGFDKEL